MLRQLSFDQEVLHLLWIKVIAFAAYALNFSELTKGSGSFNVLEVDVWIFTEVDDAPEVVVEALSCPMLLEEFDQASWSE